VVTGIEELGIHRVTVVGNGEPTLHPEFGQFIGRLGNVASYVSVLTNAQWHNADEIIAAILQARVRTIEISLDGTDKESYERARVGGNFERLISNLTLLKKLKARTHRRVLTNIRLMLRPSERPLEQSMKKYWRQFADTVMAQYLQERKALRLQKDLYKPAHHLSQEFPRCSQPSNVLGVNWNGNVPLCNFSVEQAGPPGLILGNIKNESLKNIWNGRVMRSYRRGHCDRIPDLMPICKGCTGN